MNLSQHLAPQVSSGPRSQGASYFRRGAVQQIDEVAGAIEATVIGSVAYRVRLEPNGRRLLVTCTCAYFLDRIEPCKHVWAALLAAEARSLRLMPPGTKPALVVIEAIDRDDDPYDEADLKPAAPAAASSTAASSTPPPSRRPSPSPSQSTPWQQLFGRLTSEPTPTPRDSQPPLDPDRLLYVVDAAASRDAGALVVELMTRSRKKDGEWSKLKSFTLEESQVRGLPAGDPKREAGAQDRRILERLRGARPYHAWSGHNEFGFGFTRFRLSGELALEMLPLLCATGRCLVRAAGEQEHLPLAWDAGSPWKLEIRIRRDDVAASHLVDGWFDRDGERIDISTPLLVLAEGLLITRTTAARLDHGGAFDWLTALRKTPTLVVPETARLDLLDALLAQPPPLADAPPELRIEVVEGTPRPRLRLAPDPSRSDRLLANVSFEYEGTIVDLAAPREVVRAAAAARAIRRDRAAEQGFVADLERLGCRWETSYWQSAPNVLRLPVAPSRSLASIVSALLAEGWHVEMEGRSVRAPGTPTLAVRSGIDWFELHGWVPYGDFGAELPALLAALERGQQIVSFDDGTLGLLPEEWLRNYASIARFGAQSGDHVRFQSSQVALLDALLEVQPQVRWDDAFARARERLRDFDGIRPLDPPSTFEGTLRGYQREGLGWFAFLEQLGFGGCLADDMGLGKTVMVLALLDGRRAAQPRNDRRPSLVVVPRSLVFNWKEEARRFTPHMRVVDFTGAARTERFDELAGADLVLTTYGTLRRDAPRLAGVEFDYVVLDEAQTIKNAQTAAAKACRLLDARHRLALSGTPVENHLGELGSLFEFLNPGLLGRTAWARLTKAGVDGENQEAQIAVLARGLRPFILRRTKEQVATELPAKTEQTIYCELERPQRALYDELLGHYRRALLERVSEQGLGRSKLQILEALLRLRQAACHPGLIDKSRSDDASAKLDVLVPRLLEASEDGYKTLVFSQFTSFLAILRARLDEQKVTYEYLDGRTRDRAGRVARFQDDPSCRLFLISLKAGGLGLNLTAAEYVFLLDPWWNPAVEAQAIDRAHRIGQSRHVFAYRLIARDTVEERVLELQQRKRRLAEAILHADGSLMGDLKREDLELLLS